MILTEGEKIKLGILLKHMVSETSERSLLILLPTPEIREWEETSSQGTMDSDYQIKLNIFLVRIGYRYENRFDRIKSAKEIFEVIKYDLGFKCELHLDSYMHGLPAIEILNNI